MASFLSKRFANLAALFFFVLLVALRLDHIINWSFWYICLPLWIWKCVGCLDCILGLAFYRRSPTDRTKPHTSTICIFLSLLYQIDLFIFELMVCARLEGYTETAWLLTFSPLFGLCLFGVVKSIFDGRNNQLFDLELFVSVNIFTFICIALRLDSFINWSWTVVLIPLWIIMGILIIVESCALLSALMSCNAPQLHEKERRFVQTTSVLYAFVIFPLLGFFILLVRKVEGLLFLNNVSICIPIFFVIFALMLMTFFGDRTESPWFGLNRPLYQIFLSKCPILQKYVNVNYGGHTSNDSNNRGSLTPDNGRTTVGATSVSYYLTTSGVTAEYPNDESMRPPGLSARNTFDYGPPPPYDQIYFNRPTPPYIQQLRVPD